MAQPGQGLTTQTAVAIVSDHCLFAECLERVLAAEPSICPRIAIGSLGEKGSSPVVVLDASTPRALLRCAELTSEGRPVILVGAEPGEDWALAALRAGARGVVPRAAGAEQLRKAVRAVADGQVWAPNHAVARALSLLSSLPESPGYSGTIPLTAREREIVQFILGGLSNKEIASRMAISHATVKTHLTSVFRKLSVRDRTQLVVLFHAQPSLASGRRRFGPALPA
jgi:DNA-binding NarL/FixJ family response regulator